MGGLALALALTCPAMADDDVSADDLYRFAAGPIVAKTYYRFADAHWDWTKKNIAYDFGWCAEAEYCRNAWSYLDDCYTYAASDNRPWLLTSLRALRAMLGKDAYAIGWMPPPAPYWRFREVP